MASRSQAEAVAKLVQEGYTVLGPADNTMGGRTLVEKDGKKFYIGSDGDWEAAPDDAQPVVMRPPGDFSEPFEE